MYYLPLSQASGLFVEAHSYFEDFARVDRERGGIAFFLYLLQGFVCRAVQFYFDLHYLLFLCIIQNTLFSVCHAKGLLSALNIHLLKRKNSQNL